jgi:hypothetical protein
MQGVLVVPAQAQKRFHIHHNAQNMRRTLKPLEKHTMRFQYKQVNDVTAHATNLRGNVTFNGHPLP